ncbi:MAG TPA: preprotein translocase subunit SecA [Ktedonobacterales bacterium]
MSFFNRILGDPNERELKRIRPIVARVNDLEDAMKALSDDELKGMTAEFKQELENGAGLDDILPEAFATVREASRRVLGQRHYDVQIIGGVVLHEGKIAEMRTGEGKTLVATLPSYLNALTGKGVHVVTVNDYLAKRDRDWMGRIHEFLGLNVGVILTTQNPQGPERRAAYQADISYGTNNEFGFDYLRDHMVPDLSLMVQRELNYAIVDEVDNILIDEARTPLIISGQAEESADMYVRFARLAPSLKEDDDYVIDHKQKAVSITEAGIDKVERRLGVRNIYDDMDLTRHLENALKAHALFKRDKDYIVRDGEVLIVDEFTGRVLAGRRYSEGLHQALEAKESVPIQRENHTMATITFQNYFRLYSKLAGMTGTALTEAEEFNKIYKLDVIVIPTNRDIRRTDQPDLIYSSEQGKFRAVVEEIRERHEAGQPVLVGTTSVENSEMLSEMLDADDVPHSVLNAKQHAREAHIVAQAGRSGAVTIATNMAGRGTDIQLGGNPAEFVEEILAERDIDPEFATEEDRAEAEAEARKRCDEDHEKVVAAGGLYIIGTERHESRRIDNQLRGRSGRQGDPGESRFFVSLQDELLRRMNADRVAGFLSRVGMDDDTPIESRAVTGMLEQAQTKVEAYNFDIRKNVVEYDDVIAAQREVVYGDRQAILEREDMHDRILDMVEHEARRRVTEHTTANLPEEWDLEGLDKSIEPWGVVIPPEVIPDQINRLKRDALADAIADAAREKYEDKERQVVTAAEEHKAVEPGGFYMRQFERAVLLQVIDALWREHIDHLDVMRQGIGLRGLAQRDPLVEFKREAYAAFDRFKSEVERNVAELALRAPVQITLPEPPQASQMPRTQTNAGALAAASGQTKSDGPQPRSRVSSAIAQAIASTSGGAIPQPANTANGNTAANGGAANGANGKPAATSNGRQNQRGGQNSGQQGKGQRPGGGSPNRPAGRGAPVLTGAPTSGTQKKPGRNDPCYCGSGKKYKVCHGR